MILLSPHMRIMLAFDPIDFRCGMDRLAAISEEIFAEDPLNGALFVFRNREATSVKILMFDGSGMWLCQKRFSKGRLQWWPSDGKEARLKADELQVILGQGSPRGVFAEPWRCVQSVTHGRSEQNKIQKNSRTTSGPRRRKPRRLAQTGEVELPAD